MGNEFEVFLEGLKKRKPHWFGTARDCDLPRSASPKSPQAGNAPENPGSVRLAPIQATVTQPELDLDVAEEVDDRSEDTEIVE